MAWDTTVVGINFRATAGYVTDNTNETYSLAGTDGAYPVSRQPNGWTNSLVFGWGGPIQQRNRNDGVDVRLAGVAYLEAASTQTFRVDLPVAGGYKVRLALGQYSTGASANIVIKDGSGGSTLLTIQDSAVADGSFVDAGGTERTGATWPGNNVQSAELTFTGTVLWLEMTMDGTYSFPSIAHLAIEQLAAASGQPTTKRFANINFTPNKAGVWVPARF